MSTPEERSESEPNEVNFRVILPNGGIRDFSILLRDQKFIDIINLVKRISPENELNGLIITTPGPKIIHGETIDNTTPLNIGQGILELPLNRLTTRARENYTIKKYLNEGSKGSPFLRKFKDDNDEDRYLLRSAIREMHGSRKKSKKSKSKKPKKPKSKGLKKQKTKKSRKSLRK